MRKGKLKKMCDLEFTRSKNGRTIHKKRKKNEMREENTEKKV